MSSLVKCSVGCLLMLTAVIGLVTADTGSGGGCHTDFYYNVDAHGRIVQAVVQCTNIDCPGTCVISGGGGGYWFACSCPGMMEQCDLHVHEDHAAGTVAIACLFGCPGSTLCQGPGQYSGGTVGGVAYAYKSTCWCE